MQSEFRVEIENVDRAVVLVLGGELDLASSPRLEQALEQAATSDCDVVVLDLRELEFMDSTGLSVLVRAGQRAETAGLRFGLVRGGAQVQRLLNLTGMDERMTIADSREELLRAL